MISLPIPEASPTTLVFFKKHMKLADSISSVPLLAETRMAKIIHTQMMTFYSQVNYKMGPNPDKEKLNAECTRLRINWLEDQGVSSDGVIIYVGGKPAYRINASKIGLRKSFFASIVDSIQDAKDTKALGLLKRDYNALAKKYEGTCTDDYKKYFAEQMQSIYSAYDNKRASLLA